MKKATVFVAGSWGTALASVLADNGLDVLLWTRNEAQAAEINERGTNEKYVPGAKLPAGIRATTDLEAAARHGEALVFVAPSSALRDVARRAKPFVRDDQLIVHATKGFETETLHRMSTVLEEELELREPRGVVVLSGPSHAEEVIQRSPTTVVVASTTPSLAEAAQDLFITPSFRVYTNPDVAGVEIAGALKNIIALGAGMSDGLGYGDNAKAALLTRGLAEIGRLGVAMGANPLTFAGLAGVGDLVVTCTSRHSRNWRAGYMLAQGRPLDDVLSSLGMVVEGVRTTKASMALAERYGVELPIASELHAVLFQGKDPRAAVEDLMGRGRTHEIEHIVRDV
ncbi:NAD(P)H-dependent glycerol-3-phosphate dehydrogenase [Paenibacillus sp.]|uniref:NAD(P)H-dependent glycerol-3-phosphate dehydrogenase n=1 Tax=Paenibacillus sp. TaxID=58172 RepID=UPI002D32665D|nr:NAD(P)H-dependent glycerol-3-phosphate dehydrogenase [Paenibacillus sp.]HZG85227.1 NAD(P)H-dependent glycerol-3-phosphate dehydrogenase [Paenibacillus sp.]